MMIQSWGMDVKGEWNGVWVPAGRLRRALEGMAADAAGGAPGASASLYLAAGDGGGLLGGGKGMGCAYAAALGAGGWRCGDGCPFALALRGGCGLAAFRVGGVGLVVAPPFPVGQTRVLSGWDDAPLRGILAADLAVGVVLVRLGRFSVALFRGGKLAASKTDSRYVKGRHSAGGTSQLRYARVREGQVRRLYGKVCEAVSGVLSPAPDYVVLGGERFTVDGLLKECPALAAMGGITLKRRLNIRDPKRDALAQAGAMLTESRVWMVDFGAVMGHG